MINKKIPFQDTFLTLSNYKEPLKNIPKNEGFGYFGVLLSTLEGDKVQCHICGKLFEGLAGHVFQKHNLKAREYKDKFKLAYTTGLVSEKNRQNLKERTLAWLRSLTPEQKLEYRDRWIRALKTKNTSHIQPKIQLETMNKRGTCPDQVLDKIKQVVEKIGHVPSLHQFVEECGTQRYKHLIFKIFGSWKNALAMLNLQPRKNESKGNRLAAKTHGRRTQNGVIVREYSDEELLEYMRIYAQETGKLPMASDCRNGVLPNMETYINRFGSMEESRKMAEVYEYVPKLNFSRKGMKYNQPIMNDL